MCDNVIPFSNGASDKDWEQLARVQRDCAELEVKLRIAKAERNRLERKLMTPDQKAKLDILRRAKDLDW